MTPTLVLQSNPIAFGQTENSNQTETDMIDLAITYAQAAITT